jgi:hypothetical protein
MCQTLTLVNIKKEFTILELSYSIIFPYYKKSESWKKEVGVSTKSVSPISLLLHKIYLNQKFSAIINAHKQ